MVRKARTLATALCCIAISTAAIAEDHSFRLLKLEGHQVRWVMPPRGPLVLTYKVVNKTIQIPGSKTCGPALTSFDELASNSNLTVDAIKAEVSEAARMWESATNVKFVETDSDDAQVLVGAQTDPTGWAFADVFFDPKAPGEFKPITKGLICFNPKQPWKVGFGGNQKAYDLRFTFTHEIGHVLGLDHPIMDSPNQIMGFKYHERFRSPQAGDMLGASKLYGKPATILIGKVE